MTKSTSRRVVSTAKRRKRNATAGASKAGEVETARQSPQKCRGTIEDDDDDEPDDEESVAFTGKSHVFA